MFDSPKFAKKNEEEIEDFHDYEDEEHSEQDSKLDDYDDAEDDDEDDDAQRHAFSAANQAQDAGSGRGIRGEKVTERAMVRVQEPEDDDQHRRDRDQGES